MVSDGDGKALSDDTEQPGNGLVRRLAGRYVLVLAAVAGLVLVDQLILHPLLVRLSWYAPALNVAGRQRMLSQKLTKAALILPRADDAALRRSRRAELRETLLQWKSAQAALREGSDELGVPKIQSIEIDLAWRGLAPHFEAMCAAAEELLHHGGDAESARMTLATKTLIEHEAGFLAAMERIVKLLEHEAAAAVFRLRLCVAGIASAILVLLLALGWFVIRPATCTIRRQVDELESQVADRTQRLSTALANLKHEIAHRERSEAERHRLAAQLAHASRVWTMGHLTAGLAHELNQPLATVANYAEACEVGLSRWDNGPRTERLRSHLALAKQAALRAGQIVHRMRRFVQPSTPAAADVEIDALVREVVELCRTEANYEGVEVSLDHVDAHATVYADAVQIQQVLVNLMQNALQAMRDSPIGERRVEIRAAVADDVVQVDVIDSGPGFVTTDSEAIFAPFYTTKRDGLGIGLSICRAIIEEYGGAIWAEAATGGGAKVSFTLPRREVSSKLRAPSFGETRLRAIESDVTSDRIPSPCVRR